MLEVRQIYAWLVFFLAGAATRRGLGRVPTRPESQALRVYLRHYKALSAGECKAKGGTAIYLAFYLYCRFVQGQQFFRNSET